MRPTTACAIQIPGLDGVSIYHSGFCIQVCINAVRPQGICQQVIEIDLCNRIGVAVHIAIPTMHTGMGSIALVSFCRRCHNTFVGMLAFQTQIVNINILFAGVAFKGEVHTQDLHIVHGLATCCQGIHVDLHGNPLVYFKLNYQMVAAAVCQIAPAGVLHLKYHQLTHGVHCLNIKGQVLICHVVTLIQLELQVRPATAIATQIPGSGRLCSAGLQAVSIQISTDAVMPQGICQQVIGIFGKFGGIYQIDIIDIKCRIGGCACEVQAKGECIDLRNSHTAADTFQVKLHGIPLIHIHIDICTKPLAIHMAQLESEGADTGNLNICNQLQLRNVIVLVKRDLGICPVTGRSIEQHPCLLAAIGLLALLKIVPALAYCHHIHGILSFIRLHYRSAILGNVQLFQISKQCLTVIVVNGSICVGNYTTIEICGIGRNIGNAEFIFQHPQILIVLITFTDILQSNGANRTIYAIGRAGQQQHTITGSTVSTILIILIIVLIPSINRPVEVTIDAIIVHHPVNDASRDQRCVQMIGGIRCDRMTTAIPPKFRLTRIQISLILCIQPLKLGAVDITVAS